MDKSSVEVADFRPSPSEMKDRRIVGQTGLIAARQREQFKETEHTVLRLVELTSESLVRHFYTHHFPHELRDFHKCNKNTPQGISKNLWGKREEHEKWVLISPSAQQRTSSRPTFGLPRAIKERNSDQVRS